MHMLLYLRTNVLRCRFISLFVLEGLLFRKNEAWHCTRQRYQWSVYDGGASENNSSADTPITAC